MKHVLRFLPLIAVVITCSCGGGNSSLSASSAQLRAIQTSGDGAGFDLRLDGKTFLGANGKTTYQSVPLGSHTLTLTNPGAGTSLASLNASFQAGTNQTAVLAGAIEDQSLTLFTYAEDTAPPASGQIKLRFVHGAHSIGPIDIYVSDVGAGSPTPTFAKVAYRTVTPVLTRAAKDFQLCWSTGSSGGLFGAFPGCAGIVGIFKVGSIPANATLVLPDAPIVPNAPPGLFTLGPPLMRILPN